MIEEELSSSHLTHYDYEDSLVLNQLYENEEEGKIFQNDAHKIYDLRPRQNGTKSNLQAQVKKIGIPVKQGGLKM